MVKTCGRDSVHMLRMVHITNNNNNLKKLHEKSTSDNSNSLDLTKHIQQSLRCSDYNIQLKIAAMAVVYIESGQTLQAVFHWVT